jgi:hypothetical protein
MASEHPLDEMLELYVLEKLTCELVADLEEHLLVCSQCCRRLIETERFVMVLRITAERLERAGGRARDAIGRISFGDGRSCRTDAPSPGFKATARSRKKIGVTSVIT